MKLLNIIRKFGIENIIIFVDVRPLRKIFFVKYTSSNDEPVKQPCVITEDFFKIGDNYKIELKPLQSGYEHPTFYISDLEKIIDSNNASVWVSANIL